MSHVLIVDDEESICWGLDRPLTETGHDVSIAASAEEAFDAAERRPPDFMVLDVRLPGLDGLSAMQLPVAVGRAGSDRRHHGVRQFGSRRGCDAQRRVRLFDKAF